MNFLKANRSNHFLRINQLATSIWNDHYVPIIGQEQVDYMLNWMYDLESLTQQHQKGDIFYLLESNELDFGFVSITEQGNAQWFINKFYVKTDSQRAGLGTQLFNFILSQHEVESIRLQVNRENYKAINFYFKLGFTIEKVADFNIGNGYFMNDFVMCWKKNG